MPTVISGTTLNALTTVSWGVMSLFANNEQGVWFDPSDLNNYMSGLGPELVTNGDFSSGTGWTIGSGWSISGGTLNYSGAYNTSYFTAASNAFVAGRYYKVTLTISGNTSGNVNVYLNVPNNAVLNPVNISGNGEKTFFLLAGATCNGLHFVGNSATGAMSIDNISVKEVTSISSATMFQNAAGTTPVTAVEQPVGLLLDKSKGLALGAEIAVNGSFASGTGWTAPTGWAISGGTANGTAVTAYLYQANASIVVNRYYEVTFTVSNYVSGSVRFFLGQNPIFGTAVSANGTYTQRFSPTINGGELGLLSSAFTGSIDNVSVKEVAGNHASQTTDAPRPVLSARVNLLTYTEQFNNTSGWMISNGSGGATIVNNKFIPNNGVLAAYINTVETSIAIGVVYKFSIRVAAAGFNFIEVYADAISGRIPGGAVFNLQSGVAVNTYGGATATCSPVGDGSHLCVVTFPASISTGAKPFIRPGVTASAAATGDGTSGIQLYTADLRPTNAGVNLPAYQRVGAAVTGTTNPAVTGVPDYDTNGFPLYLRFDGVDDSLSTNSIDFTATDKMSVFAGHRIVSGTGSQLIFELGTDAFASSGFAFVQGPANATSGLGFLMNAGSSTAAQTADKSVPYTSVSSLLLNSAQSGISNEGILRFNTILQTYTSTAGFTDSGTANFPNKILYIGSRAGNSFRFNGHLYNLIIRGALSNSVDITNTEAYINSKTKAY